MLVHIRYDMSCEEVKVADKNFMEIAKWLCHMP